MSEEDKVFLLELLKEAQETWEDEEADDGDGRVDKWQSFGLSARIEQAIKIVENS